MLRENTDNDKEKLRKGEEIDPRTSGHLDFENFKKVLVRIAAIGVQ